MADNNELTWSRFDKNSLIVFNACIASNDKTKVSYEIIANKFILKQWIIYRLVISRKIFFSIRSDFLNKKFPLNDGSHTRTSSISQFNNCLIYWTIRQIINSYPSLSWLAEERMSKVWRWDEWSRLKPRNTRFEKKNKHLSIKLSFDYSLKHKSWLESQFRPNNCSDCSYATVFEAH